MQVISNVSGAPAPVGAYSPAIIHGDTVYCSGQIGLNPASGVLVEGGIEQQTKQVLANLEAVLNACGASKDSLVMVTVFLDDIADGPAINALYSEFVNADSPPARQTVAVSALPMGALVEISAIAALKSTSECSCDGNCNG